MFHRIKQQLGVYDFRRQLRASVNTSNKCFSAVNTFVHFTTILLLFDYCSWCVLITNFVAKRQWLTAKSSRYVIDHLF